MDVKLHLIKGNPKGKQVDVPAGTVAVGRAEDSDVIIASTRVSRNHCEFVHEENALRLRDKESANGTLVNGEKITETELHPGDEVQIGPLTFLVEIDGNRTPADPKPEAAPAPEAAPQAEPAPAKPAPAPKPTGDKPPTKPPAKPRGGEDDIFSSLERMAGGEKKKAEGGKESQNEGDVLRLSDDDLLGE